MFMTVGITLREESIVGIDEKMKWGGGGLRKLEINVENRNIFVRLNASSSFSICIRT